MAISSHQLCPAVDTTRDCPICAGFELTTIVDIAKLPALVCSEFLTPQDALAAPSGRVHLSYCHTCGQIFNRRYNDSIIEFKPGYSASLAHTDSFRQHIEVVANRLIERYELHNRTILEIGCGDAYFLRQLCSLGSNNGVGIDPTIGIERTEQVGHGSLHLIGESFSDKHHSIAADLVCSISVFEALPDPKRTLLDVRQICTLRDDAVVYFEVPNADYMFDHLGIWSIYYEQFCHFTLDTLVALFHRCGFEILDSGTCYNDDQYLYVEARPNAHAPRKEDVSLAVGSATLPARIEKFSDAVQTEISCWKNVLENLARSKKRVVVWGSGGKGNTFLSVMRDKDLIRYVVDINPDRHGKFVPGLNKQIVAPSFLKSYRPDTIIVTNPIYETEIRTAVAEMGLSCDFLML